ncbi:MAG: methylmalonyl Co-A mutase-associated GTPase MeaB [Dysgonamonadaceae bacterium]|jgi:LAO/AO transport system kinase|nr:methylmalonyl Co-A mutase-associated GTPase MeaB [Dysgonamonadaceae bacterium]
MHHIENDLHYTGLSVAQGIASPPAVNPYLKKRKHRHEFTAAEYIEQILKGNITVLSQAVTLVESQKNEHQALAQEVIEKCLPYSGHSVRIGITGVPGAGKSTSIDVFGMHLIRDRGKKLAVLAIDPSSERSKGSILGDKTRMEDISREPSAFIRPSPSAGSLGGVARKTHETIILCEAAGFDTVFVETVGVGQSETAVHSMVDFFLLIQVPGTGDELQGIKRGIMEMADGIIVNKADGTNIDRANLSAAQYRNALHLFPLPPSGWSPKVLTYSAKNKTGITEIWDMVYEYIAFVKENGYFNSNHHSQAKFWMYSSINEQLKNHFYHSSEIEKELKIKEQQVLNAEISSFMAAKQMLDLYFRQKS